MFRAANTLTRRLAMWVAPGVMAVTGLASGGGPPQPTDPQPVLSSLNRLLRRFDFEEAQRVPHTMPINFYRYIAADQGFPPFGTMRLTNEVAHSGNWSFGFELDGGSLSARIPTAVIPVLPGSDYTVSTWIRTEGLVHAKARLVAWLHDARGDPIPQSRTDGPLLRPGARWQQTSVSLRADYDDAADLIVELQVLQPRQFTWSSRNADEPLLEDVSGRVWFDDLIVWQSPRIELSTSSPGNVVDVADDPTLTAFVRDLTNAQLTARLRVYDLDGEPLHDEFFTLPQGSWERRIDLTPIDSGWYRAVLEVGSRGELVARQLLDFVVLPKSVTRRRPRVPHRRFGVVVPQTPADGEAQTIVRLIQHLGVGSAALALSDDAQAIGDRPDRHTALRQTVDELLLNDMELTLVLPQVSHRAEQQLGDNHTDVLALLKRKPEPDGHGLPEALMSFGTNIRRWQIGAPTALQGVGQQRLEQWLDTADRTLGEFMAQPIILVGFSMEDELPTLPSPHGYWVTVPYHVGGDSLAAYASRWPIGEGPLVVTLQRLAADQYPPRQRAVDLALRTLHGWRAGLPNLTITAPWSRRGRPRAQIMPDPSFSVWRVLTDHLSGRTFGGELPVVDGVRCWILNGSGEDDTALVAWNEQAPDGAGVIELMLAHGPVRVIDLFGNSRIVEPQEGRHKITLDRLPVFIEHVDGKLAEFRAAVAISPSAIEARHEVHERQVLLSNPWDITITGTIHLEPPPGWRITPRIHRFAIRPHEQVQLPVTVVFDRSVPTGRARIEAEVELTADRPYHLRVCAGADLGWKGIEFAAYWHATSDERSGTADLIITQYVTNTADRPVSLDAFVSAPGMSQQRRALSALAPGRTMVRTFRLTNGVALLAGKQIRVGVRQRDGTARLNQVLEIPALPQSSPRERVVSHP